MKDEPVQIQISKCPDCGARSDEHPVVGIWDGGNVRQCHCGGLYDSGILGGIEFACSCDR